MTSRTRPRAFCHSSIPLGAAGSRVGSPSVGGPCARACSRGQAQAGCGGARCCCSAWLARSLPQVRVVRVGASRTFADSVRPNRSRLPVDCVGLHHRVSAADRPPRCALPPPSRAHTPACLRLPAATGQGCLGSRAAHTFRTTRWSRPRAVSTLPCSAGAPARLSACRIPSLTVACARRNAQGAVLVSPHATGARFTMYLLNLGAFAAAVSPPAP